MMHSCVIHNLSHASSVRLAKKRMQSLDFSQCKFRKHFNEWLLLSLAKFSLVKFSGCLIQKIL